MPIFSRNKKGGGHAHAHRKRIARRRHIFLSFQKPHIPSVSTLVCLPPPFHSLSLTLSGAGKESWPKGNPPNPSPVAAWFAPPVQFNVPFSSINDHSSGAAPAAAAAAAGMVAGSAPAAAGVLGDPCFVLAAAAGRRMGMSIALLAWRREWGGEAGRAESAAS